MSYRTACQERAVPPPHFCIKYISVIQLSGAAAAPSYDAAPRITRVAVTITSAATKIGRLTKMTFLVAPSSDLIHSLTHSLSPPAYLFQVRHTCTSRGGANCASRTPKEWLRYSGRPMGCATYIRTDPLPDCANGMVRSQPVLEVGSTSYVNGQWFLIR